MRTTSRKRLIAPNDGMVLSALAVVVGTIRVAIALANDEAFGAEATVALAALVLGIIGVAATLWRR